MTQDSLFTPLVVGSIEVPNRVWMAPLTRMRGVPDGTNMPAENAALYYEQRSSAGLLINEGTVVCPEAVGYAGCPGIYNEAQVQAWKPICAAVKAKGGHFCCQLWHVGRVSCEELQPDNEKPRSPSAVKPNDTRCNTRNENNESVRTPCPEPRAMTIEEIKDTVKAYGVAAKNSIEAGFDMVEIHGAHGYLVQQFMSKMSNCRDDIYGGSVENRCRFAFEVIDACVEAIGADKVGFRHSAFVKHHDCEFSDWDENIYFITELAKRNIAYLHLSEPDFVGGKPLDIEFRQKVREIYKGVIVCAGSYTVEKARDLIQRGLIDAVAWGRPFISNPDLPERISHGAEWAEADPSTYYSPGNKGYVDYPSLSFTPEVPGV